MGLNGIYAMDISCLDEHEVCLGEPYLLFDWKEAIPKGTNGGSPATINWSPDGTKVVISIENKLILANEDGEHAIYLTGDCAAANWPKWSPDGGQIAFIFNPGRLPDCEMLESSQIQLYNLETGEMQPILSDVLAPSRINWLPEGKMAYISRISETDYREVIRIVDREGKLLQQIPENPGDFTSLIGLDFSPDGNRLAFVGDIVPESGAWKTDIYISDLNTNSILNLTNGSGDNFDPVWAPTGDWIAFMSNREGNWDIYLIRPDGSGLINDSQNPASDDDPAWRLVAPP